MEQQQNSGSMLSQKAKVVLMPMVKLFKGADLLGGLVDTAEVVPKVDPCSGICISPQLDIGFSSAAGINQPSYARYISLLPSSYKHPVPVF